MKYLPFLSFFFILNSYSQQYTQQDTLRGSITPQRAWWNLTHYNLHVEVKPDEQYISGTNTITFEVLDENQILQIELQKPMKIDKIIEDSQEIYFTSKGYSHFIKLQKKQKKGASNQITIYFSGKPTVAKLPPWDGGFTWKKDSNENHFIATSNQGIGASIWWPNKDHAYDEPDKGMNITITAPKKLVAVSNGRLQKVVDHQTTKTWYWKVINPINNYGVNINIADYVHFGEKYQGEKGMLDMDYYVLRENEAKAKKQFQQAPKMMKAFEYWFGPYPFYEDSYKLVEVPYLGMEHQSSVTYGNHFKNGYLGRDLSNSGWGLKFDFIIIHESGHEWFANNITHIDIADMWIHEGFTAYSESLYLDYYFGKNAASEYIIGTRKTIKNDKPIIGTYNLQQEGSGDMYYKGANILHTLRQLIDHDGKWRAILRDLNQIYYHQTVSSQEIEDCISELSGIDLTEFWDQYLRSTQIPKIEYKTEGRNLIFRYINIIENFDMPVIAIINNKEEWIFPTSSWKTKEFDYILKSVKIKEDFYVESEIIE